MTYSVYKMTVICNKPGYKRDLTYISDFIDGKNKHIANIFNMLSASYVGLSYAQKDFRVFVKCKLLQFNFTIDGTYNVM